jgi:acyl carrier protein
MTKDDVATIVRQIICNKFELDGNSGIDHYSLWYDLDADDLDYVEICMALEDRFAVGDFDCFDLEDYRNITVRELIDHAHAVVDSVRVNAN